MPPVPAPRLYCPPQSLPAPPCVDVDVDLPAAPARHVQVLRLQPGHTVNLFDGSGHGWWQASVIAMRRSSVTVHLHAYHALPPQPPRAPRVHLMVGIPANDRMDWLVEKATELGVYSIHPLLTERSVLRISGERASKRQAHWQATAIAACEQSGRLRVPTIHPVEPLDEWLRAAPPDRPATTQNWCLSFNAAALPLRCAALAAEADISLLSGPEGGLTPQEEALALTRDFHPATLGDYTLRADTAPLAALSLLMLR